MPTRRSLLLGMSGCALAPIPLRAQGTGSLQLAPPNLRGPRSALAPLQAAMTKGRFIAYHPTGAAIWNGRASRASEQSIVDDLTALRPWFDCLITYGARNGTEIVPDIAARLGYRAIIQGIWHPADDEEIASALGAWRRNPRLVAGLSLGNEIILSRRGTWGDIGYAIRRIRAMAPALPLATTEPFPQFLNDQEASSTLLEMDFLLANVHPIFQPWFFQKGAPEWAELVVQVAALLRQRFAGPVIVKETGVPSGPVSAGFSEAMQRDFWRRLEQRMPPGPMSAFAYFSAFDLPWAAYQTSPPDNRMFPHEAHWGLFDAQRSSKTAIAELLPLQQA